MEQFVAIPPEDVAARGKAIDQVMVKLARSEQLTVLEVNGILHYIVSANPKRLTAATLKARIKELKGGDLISGTDHTEIARHLRKEIERYGELRYHNTRYYQWKGSHWDQLEDVLLFKVLAENFGSLQAARRNSDHKGIIATLSALVSQPIKIDETNGINFANGYLTVDLELRDHNPKYGARYTLPYRYVPSEMPPQRFLAFLDQCWGEDPDYLEKVQALREAMAATMFGVAYKLARAVLLYGPSHTGKTTLAEIMMGMIPTEVKCVVPPQDWADKFMPAQMYGKLLNFAGELSETLLIPGEKFKLIVEGSDISAQHKGTQIFQFSPVCAQWFASNFLPRSRDTSGGFTRRWLILQFNKIVRASDKVLDLGMGIVADEREAIAAWIVSAIPGLMSRGHYTLPSSHDAVVEDLSAQNCNVKFFLKSGRLIKKEGASTDEANIYSLYYNFCRGEAHSMPYALKRFRATMGAIGHESGEFSLAYLKSPDGNESATYRGLALPSKRT